MVAEPARGVPVPGRAHSLLTRSWGPWLRWRRRYLRAPTHRPASPSSFSTGSSTAGARAATACASPQALTPPLSCGCRYSASSTRRRWAATSVGTTRTRRSLDAVSRASLGLLAGPARGRRGVRAELPYVPAHQGQPTAPGRSQAALPVACPDMLGRLQCRCISQDLLELPPARSGSNSCSAHRPPHWPSDAPHSLSRVRHAD
jgi:hypothetical protein